MKSIVVVVVAEREIKDFNVISAKEDEADTQFNRNGDLVSYLGI